jgi:Spy/CpxP family protein refolding chaperone
MIRIRLFSTLLLASVPVAAIWAAQDKPPPPPAVAPPAATQPDAKPPVAGGQSQNGLNLLDNEVIRLELKVTPEQREKIQELIQSAQRDFQAVYSKVPNEEQRKQIRTQIENRVNAVYQDYRRRVEDILTPEQRRRLQELIIRSQGMKSVDNPDVADALNLAPEQKAKVHNAIQHSREMRHEIVRSTRGEGKSGRDERRAKLAQNRADLDQNIQKILTPDQLAKFEQLKGTDVDQNVTAEPGAPEQLGGRNHAKQFQ